MQNNHNNFIHQTPAQMRSKAFIGSSTVNLILLVSFIASGAYWYALSVQASSSEVSGLWEILLWSIVAVGVVTEIVKKVTLSTFRHKSIWLGATFVSVLTVMGTFSILDANRESGLIKQSDQYKTAQARSENALNNASSYAWASGFNLVQLNNQLQKVVSDRENRTIRYQAYLSKKKAINEKIEAKRAYDSAMGMQTMAGESMSNTGTGATSSNPLLSNIATATGIGANVLKTGFYLAVTLLLEFSAFWIGGRVEELKNKMNMTRAQLLDLQNAEVFGISIAEISNGIYKNVLQAENDQLEAEQEVRQIRHNREDNTAGETAEKVQEIRAESEANLSGAKGDNSTPTFGFVNTDNFRPKNHPKKDGKSILKGMGKSEPEKHPKKDGLGILNRMGSESILSASNQQGNGQPRKRKTTTADTGISGKNGTRYRALKKAVLKGDINLSVAGIKKFKYGGKGMGSETAKKYLTALNNEGLK